MNKKILNKNNIFIDVDIKTQNDLFKFVAKKALEFKYVEDEKALIKSFKDREKESTTGFEDGFAIPYARIKGVKQAAIFYIKLKNKIDWNSMDGQGTDIILALLIPDTKEEDLHL